MTRSYLFFLQEKACLWAGKEVLKALLVQKLTPQWYNQALQAQRKRMRNSNPPDTTKTCRISGMIPVWDPFETCSSSPKTGCLTSKRASPRCFQWSTAGGSCSWRWVPLTYSPVALSRALSLNLKPDMWFWNILLWINMHHVSYMIILQTKL